MTELVYNRPLPFEGSTFLVHVSFDNRVYVRLDDLCNLLCLDWRNERQLILEDNFLNDKLVVFNVEANNEGIAQGEDVLFFDFGALPYWLDTLMRSRIKRLDVRKQVVRFASEYISMSWILMKYGFITPYSEQWKPTKKSRIRLFE